MGHGCFRAMIRPKVRFPSYCALGLHVNSIYIVKWNAKRMARLLIGAADCMLVPEMGFRAWFQNVRFQLGIVCLPRDNTDTRHHHSSHPPDNELW